MSVEDYFNASHQERAKLRAVVLKCLELINARRMSVREELEFELELGEMKLDDSGGGVGCCGGQHVYIITDQSFNGVLAGSKITALEMWVEILLFV